MDVLLMAAGFGSRLKDRTKNLPKALISVKGKTLLEHALDGFLGRPWVERAVVVTGYRRDLVAALVREKYGRKPVLEVMNSDYRLGNIYSLARGLEHIGAAFVVTNVDHIFPEALLDQCHAQADDVRCAVDFDRRLTPDCMKVKLAPDRRVERIHKRLKEYDCGYIGMTFVQAAGRERYVKAVGTVLGSGDPKAYAEMAVQRLADQGEPAGIVDGSGFGWLEIDDETDFQRAQESLRDFPDFIARGRRAVGQPSQRR